MPLKSPLPLLLGPSLLVASCGTLDQPWVNPDHCANREGDAFCAQRHPDGDLPYCSNACPPFSNQGFSSDGCRATRPSDACWSPCGDQRSLLEDGSCVSVAETTTTTGGTTDASTSSYPTPSESGIAITGASSDDIDMATDEEGTATSTAESGAAACLDDEDCPSPSAPGCDPLSHMCVPCNAAPDPHAACRHLDPALPICFDNACVACSDEEQGICEGETPRCFEHACVACSQDDHCHGETPVCFEHACVACSQDDLGNCEGTTPVCNTVLHTCTGCTAHDQCPAHDPSSGGAGCNLLTGACLSPDLVLHVDGDMACPGMGTEEHPYCDLGTALASAAGQGDATLVLHDAVSAYAETLVIQGDDTIAIFAAPGETPRWRDAGGTTPAPQLTILEGATVFLRGLTLALNGEAEAIHIEDASAALEACTLSQNAGAIVATASVLMLDRCTLRQNGSGIEAFDTRLSLDSCVLAENAGGIATAGGTLDLRNSFVTAGTNDTDAVMMGDGTEATLVYSSLAAQAAVDGTSRALVCDDTTTARIRNSLFVSASADDEVQCPSAEISHSAAEMELPGESNTALGSRLPTWFIDFGGGDLHLQEPPEGLSTAALWSSGDPASDIDGHARPTESGALDYAGADVPTE